MGATLTEQRRVEDEGPWVVNSFSVGREKGRYHRNKSRLTTCQQPRKYVGGKRYPELLGVKRTQAVD